jgi:TP901 family phage tail tape measure protein
MAEKKIGAKIVIDGESEFRANLNSAKQALGNFQSELKLVTSGYKDNANSLEALRAKQEVYTKLQDEQNKKIQLLSEMQEKAIKKYEQEQTVLENLGKKRETLNESLEEAKSVYGENSEEVKKLTQELENADKEYESQERVVQKTGDKVNTYTKDLNNAQTELNDLNSEIEKNEKYMSEAESSADGCAKSIDEYGNEVDEAKDKTSVFSDVLKAELLSDAIKDGIKAIAEGIKKIATAAVSTGSEFEASMSQVAATMGITTAEIESGSESYQLLSQAAQDCGKSTMYSASQAAEALNYLALAGYDAEKSAETLPKVLNLAAAGGLELADASDMVTDSMAALGMETEELDNYIDEMAKTSQKSNTSVSQLGAATLVCAGTVSLTGQSIETMNTALGVLANNGIKGAEGGTHLRNVLLTLSAPTDTASKAINALGLEVYNSSGEMKDLNTILEEMNDLMSDMTEGEKTETIAGIFNKTDVASVNSLLKSTTGEWSKLKAEISDCSGAAQDMADTMNENLKGKVTILQSALEGLGITVYGLFDDTMKDSVESATNAVGRLQDSIDNGDLGVSLTNLSKAMGDFTASALDAAEGAIPKVIDALTWILNNGDIIAGLIGGITTAKLAYTAATKAAAVAQELFNVTANANPYIALATAIGGVVGAITLYTATTTSAADTFSDSVKKLTDSSKKLNDESKEAAQTRDTERESLENEMQVCTELISELERLQESTELTTDEQARQQAIIEQLNEAIPDLNLNIDEQTGKLNMTTDALYDNVDAYMALAKAEAARDDLTEIAREQYEAEKQLADLRNKEAEATEQLSQAQDELNQYIAMGIYNNETAMAAVGAAERNLAELKDQITETSGTIDSLGEEYAATMQYISDDEAVDSASEAISDLGDTAEETGEKISTMSDEVLEAYNEMFSDLSETIKGQMNLFSEFSKGTAMSTTEMLGNMQSQVDGISEWADDLDELADRGINKGLLRTLAEMGPTGAAYVQTFVDMTEEELEKANEIYKEAMKLPDSVALNITDSYYSAGENAAQGYIDGIDDSSEDVEDASEKLGKKSYERLESILDEHSPSKVTEGIGVNFDKGLANGITRETSEVLTSINAMAQQMLVTARQGMAQELYEEVGYNIAMGLANGIESGEAAVKAAIQKLCSGAISTAKITLDIHSPSKEFEYLGEMSGEGYIVGWQQRMSDINSIISDSLPDTQSISTSATSIQGGTEQGGTDGIVVNQYIYANETDYRGQQREAAKNFRLIARMV